MKLASAGLFLLLIPIVTALVPANNTLDNQSYIQEANTTTTFEIENHEIFVSEITPSPIIVISNSAQPSSSSGSSGGGGGGGSTPSPENHNNIAKLQKIEKWWNTGVETTYTFDMLNIIKEISIVPNKSIGLVEVRVEELKNKSELTLEAHNIIHYFNVWVGTTGTNKFIERAYIKLNITDVILLKWNNDSQIWAELESTDKGFEVNSFSSFAIVKKQPVQETVSPLTNPPMEVKTHPSTHIPTETPKQASGFEVILLIIGISGLWLLKKKS